MVLPVSKEAVLGASTSHCCLVAVLRGWDSGGQRQHRQLEQ